MDKLRNLTIGALILLSIYQITNLWIFDLSTLEVKNSYKTNNISVENIKIPPKKIITNYETNKNDIIYNDILQSNQLLLAEDILKEVDIKEFIDSYPLDQFKKNYDLNIILSYPVPLTIDDSNFANVLATNKAFAKIKTFDKISISKNNLNNSIHIYFISYDDNLIYTFTKESDSLSTQLNKLCLSAKDDSKDLYYTSADIFSKVPSFLPNVNDYTYNQITFQNPYSNNGEILLSSVEVAVNNFFDDPSSKWATPNGFGGAFTFSDSKITVNYYPNNVLDYVYYTYKNVSSTSIAQDYKLALNFIENDEFVNNAYYLTNIEESDNMRIFYFDYVINNIPITIDETFADPSFISTSIKICVSDNAVTNYRKIAYNFSNLETLGELSNVLFLDSAEIGYANYKLSYILSADNKINMNIVPE